MSTDFFDIKNTLSQLLFRGSGITCSKEVKALPASGKTETAVISQMKKGMVIVMLCSESIVACITALAVLLAKDKTENEIAMLSTIFVQLGDTLDTIASSKNVDRIL